MIRGPVVRVVDVARSAGLIGFARGEVRLRVLVAAIPHAHVLVVLDALGVERPTMAVVLLVFVGLVDLVLFATWALVGAGDPTVALCGRHV